MLVLLDLGPSLLEEGGPERLGGGASESLGTMTGAALEVFSLMAKGDLEPPEDLRFSAGAPMPLGLEAKNALTSSSELQSESESAPVRALPCFLFATAGRGASILPGAASGLAGAFSAAARMSSKRSSSSSSLLSATALRASAAAARREAGHRHRHLSHRRYFSGLVTSANRFAWSEAASSGYCSLRIL